MNPLSSFRVFLRAWTGGVLLGLLAWGTQTNAFAADSNTIRVLFIGNSQMYTCDLPLMVKTLADSSADGQPRITVGKGILGGRGLQGYWDAGEAKGSPRAMVAAGPWDVVILQEAYDIWDEPFNDYAAKFDQLIRINHSKTLLFATASISSLYSDGFTKLSDVQAQWGKSHGVPCACAGTTWVTYLGRQPTREQLLDLYAPDTKHPGKKGSYLYACLLYAHLTNRNPQGLTYTFAHLGGAIMTAEEAARMQQIAWQQYQADQRSASTP